MSRDTQAERSFQRDLSSPIEERRFDVGTPDHGRRLDVFLAERISWRSRTRIRALIDEGRVIVEPAMDPEPPARPGRLRSGARLRAGDRVVVRLASAYVDAAANAGAESEARTDEDRVDALAHALEVVFEDAHLLAVAKPPFVNLYPTKRHLGGSLVELVHRRQRALGGGPAPSPCHRLDRETSGLVLFAKDRATRADVGRQFEERTVEKTYLAVVMGVPREDEGVVDLPLGRDLGSRVEIKQGARHDGGGAPARTRWRVRERYRVGGADAGDLGRPGAPARPMTLLELHPETGRQHQLRAHLAAIGHPIAGDKLYLGGDDLFLASLDRALDSAELGRLGGFDRLALHAWRLTFRHPATGGRLTLEAPPSEDLTGTPKTREAPNA